jgi:hypothetical protein
MKILGESSLIKILLDGMGYYGNNTTSIFKGHK